MSVKNENKRAESEQFWWHLLLGMEQHYGMYVSSFEIFKRLLSIETDWIESLSIWRMKSKYKHNGTLLLLVLFGDRWVRRQCVLVVVCS